MLQPSTAFLVTGAASGIGKATSELLISRSHRVGLCDVDARAAADLADTLGTNAAAIAQQTFQKTEPALRLPMKPSEYIRRQVRFTPFPTEPVGWLVEQAGDELFLFSSDYPHPEGGHDPLGRFERSMDGISEAAKERFYSANFAHMMHWPQPLGGARDVVHSGVT